MKTAENKKRFAYLEYGLILLVFAVCLTGAILIPMEQCPDEQGRLILTEWIAKNGALPTGNEGEVMIPGWGYSYAIYPCLSSIVGAVFMKAAMAFTASNVAYLAAARLCSVLSITGCCCFCLLIGRMVFEKRSSTLLFATLVCFLPQVMFLGMYHNNDSLSLLAVSMMLYYIVNGFERKYPVRSCIGLALALSVGLLSYYTIYGWLLMGALFWVVAVLKDPEISRGGGGNPQTRSFDRGYLPASCGLVLPSQRHSP